MTAIRLRSALVYYEALRAAQLAGGGWPYGLS